MPGNRQLFLDHVAQTSESPLMFEPVRGQGVYLFDDKDKAYLDLISGIGVSAMGHCHPDVVEVIRRQAGLYLHTMVYGEHVQEPQVRLAEFLTSLLPDRLDSVYFVNSGSEATEGALKLAKKSTGRKEIVAFRKAYHGSTHGAMSLMSDPYFSRAYRPFVPGTRFIELDEPEELDHITDQTAAVILETVQGEAGFRVPDPAYMKSLRERCDETGALLILDEIQAGMGRTGSLWAFERFDIEPDILLLAKGFGGGLPLGAFVAGREIMESLTDNPILGHITTFGGHPLCCAAALANLTALTDGDWVDRVPEKEGLFRELLQHPDIGQVRGTGLMLAVELPDFDYVRRVMELGLKLGYLTDWFLYDEEAIRLSPPLIISDSQVEEACRLLLLAFDEIRRERG